jgi:type IV pilus assembly protein PilP
MLNYVNGALWVVLLCLAGSAAAQERIVTPSQKSKEAVDKLKAAPQAVGETLQAFGKTVGAKLGLGAGSAKSPHAAADPETTAEKPAEAAPPSFPLIVKRDPFRPFTLDVKITEKEKQKRSPLERYELGQLKLVGVIWDVKQPNAMVEDGAGLGYVVKPGTPIGPNDGKVKKIQPAGVVIEEYEVDIYGTKRKVERTMRLATEKAE